MDTTLKTPRISPCFLTMLRNNDVPGSFLLFFVRGMTGSAFSPSSFVQNFLRRGWFSSSLASMASLRRLFSARSLSRRTAHSSPFSVQVFKAILLSKYKAKKVKERYTEGDRTCDKRVKLNCRNDAFKWLLIKPTKACRIGAQKNEVSRLVKISIYHVVIGQDVISSPVLCSVVMQTFLSKQHVFRSSISFE